MSRISMTRQCSVSKCLALLAVSWFSLGWAGEVMAAGTCVGQPDGTPCDDDNVCTQFDQCTGGVCIGMPVNVSDGNDCTIDSCDSKVGAVHEPAPDGTPCDDTPYGGGPGYCQNGQCLLAAVPTVSNWGVAIMALLVVGAGCVVFRRRAA